MHQGGGQLATEHELLRSVSVGHDALEQLHALHHTRLDLMPVGVTQHQWDEVERPWALGLVGGRIHVVGDAVVAHLPLQVGHAGVQVGGPQWGCSAGRARWSALLVNERLPCGTDRRSWGRAFRGLAGRCGGWAGHLPMQLVPMPLRRALLLERQPSHGVRLQRGRGLWRAVIHPIHCRLKWARSGCPCRRKTLTAPGALWCSAHGVSKGAAMTWLKPFSSRACTGTRRSRAAWRWAPASPAASSHRAYAPCGRNAPSGGFRPRKR